MIVSKVVSTHLTGTHPGQATSTTLQVHHVFFTPELINFCLGLRQVGIYGIFAWLRSSGRLHVAGGCGYDGSVVDVEVGGSEPSGMGEMGDLRFFTAYPIRSW